MVPDVLRSCARYFGVLFRTWLVVFLSVNGAHFPRNVFWDAAKSCSQYISSTYRQEYFKNIVEKPVCFYDKDENSAGTLTSRLATDPTQLQELFGLNMAFPLIAVFNVMGCVAISVGSTIRLLIRCLTADSLPAEPFE